MSIYVFQLFTVKSIVISGARYVRNKLKREPYGLSKVTISFTQQLFAMAAIEFSLRSVVSIAQNQTGGNGARHYRPF